MELSERIGRRMKLRDLHVLMTVVEEGSMGKAAQRLHTVQPAISRSIAQLEQALGVRLVDRHRQGIEPTKYGRALLECGIAVFDDLRRGVKNIEFLADPTAGEIRIGCNPFLASTFVTAVVDRLARNYPRVTFHLSVSPVEDLHRLLVDRSVDLLVTRKVGPVTDRAVRFDPLFDDSFVVAAGTKHPLARRRQIRLADLASEPWVLPPPESVIGSTAREAFRTSGLEYPRAAVVAIPLEVRTSMLASGRFLTIFPASALTFARRRPEVSVLPVKLPVARVPSGIVTLSSRSLSPVAQLFVEYARDIAKRMNS